jgi:hypothetical protein
MRQSHREQRLREHWSLELVATEQPLVFRAVLRLEDIQTNRYLLRTITAHRPRASRLTLALANRNADAPKQPDSKAARRALRFDALLGAGLSVVPGKIGFTTYSVRTFFVLLPRRPWWVRSSSTRVEIEVAAEEISAARPIKRFIARSQAIEWTASSSAKTA